ncbi:D,D-heptose 1,7-bisphosphate phosphatase [Salmonella enterica subsp. enterica]|uniref:D,D-heptose 1,7-bisphosphate phosphatase n=1 Tax=Salmonella enterica I TaxID=59201 RepID=A0A379WZ93_SALET|nr:D,D-heptose 1,7-bisphosphate phosphatase [Salmonella enterica subsp. enterica]
MAKSVPAIFLDRDGTINVDHGYVHEIDAFEFIDGVIDAMRELKKNGLCVGGGDEPVRNRARQIH